MSEEIRHQWNGTVLTVISDSGASSADLKGPKGDTGPRGPQGPGGVIYNEDGELTLDLSEYYTSTEVDNLVDSVTVDLSDYATKAYVTETLANEINYNDDLASKNYVITEIARAQLEGAGVDTSGFATDDDIKKAIAEIDFPDASIDNLSVVRNKNGEITTSFGGSARTEYKYSVTGLNVPFTDGNIQIDNTDMKALLRTNGAKVLVKINYLDGVVDTFVTTMNENGLTYIGEATGTTYCRTIVMMTNVLMVNCIGSTSITAVSVEEHNEKAILTGGYICTPIIPYVIPVDGKSIIINDEGFLEAVGSAGLASAEEVDY